MLNFFNIQLSKHLSINDLENYKNDFIYLKNKAGSEKLIYKKDINLLNESFMIEFVFRDNQLHQFNIESSKAKYIEADTLHQKWLEKNFGQNIRWVGKELHYITDEYDFYSYYDPRSGSAEIWCRVFK